MSDLFAQPEIVAAEAAHVIEKAEEIFPLLSKLDFHARVHAINRIRAELSSYSPFASEPVDCIQWIPASCCTLSWMRRSSASARSAFC